MLLNQTRGVYYYLIDQFNVLPVLGVCLNNNPFFLILELMEASDLLAFLRGARQENVSDHDTH